MQSQRGQAADTFTVCDYLVGCDGASSFVRKSIGSEFVGTPVLQHAQSFHVRAPQLRSLLPDKPAWLYFSLNPRRCCVTMAVDGRETWNIQNYRITPILEKIGLDHLDRDWVIASRIISNIGYQVMMRGNQLSPEIERQDAVGEAARAAAGQRAYALDVEQQCCGDLNFGYFYDRSPIIAYDGEQAPIYTMGTFTSTTVPGCRVPNVWIEGRRLLYDEMGPDYTLLRLDPKAHVAGIVAAAAQRGLTLAVLGVRSRDILRRGRSQGTHVSTEPALIGATLERACPLPMKAD
jgi:FAD binding domain